MELYGVSAEALIAGGGTVIDVMKSIRQHLENWRLGLTNG